MVLKRLLVIYNLAEALTLPFFQRGSFCHAGFVRYPSMRSLVGTCKDSPLPRCYSAHEIERDSCMGVVSALFFFFSAILRWDGRQQVLPSVGCEVTQWCCFGKRGCFAARWQLLVETVMALCSLQELQHQLPP